VEKSREIVDEHIAGNKRKSSDLEDRLATLERMLQHHPESSHLLEAIADLMLLLGRGYDALNRYEQARRLGPIDAPHIGRVCASALRRHYLADDIILHLASLLEEFGAYREAATITREVVMRSTTEEYVLSLFARQLERSIHLVEDESDETALRIELAQVLLKLRRRDEALVHLQQFKPGMVKEHELVKQIARQLMMLKDYAGAFQHLRNIPLDDETIALMNDIALAQESEGDLEAAVSMLQYVNKHHESMREYHEAEERDFEMTTELSLAELNMKKEAYEDALKSFVRVLQQGYEPIDEILRQVDRILPKIPIASYSHLFELGRFCVDHEHFNHAAAYVSRVLQAMPGDSQVQALMREVYDGLIDRSPNIPEIRLKSAQLHQDLGEFDKAITEYTFCLKFPDIKEAAAHPLCVCLIQAEQFDQALDLYAKLRLNEEDFEPLHTLYEVFSASGELRKALKALNLIRKRNPQYRDLPKKIAALEEKLRKAEGKMMADPKMKELIGDLADVGRYRYVGKIGSGGMGVVHKVFDMKNNNIVAMKILREGLAGSGKAIDRFYREARIAAKLNHPHIVNIFDYSIGNVQGNSYITMEFVDGPSLRDIIEKKFASTIDVSVDDICEALYYISQICDALSATHTKGIIHRDIKPDNILVNSEGSVKITDFGIVHVEEATFTPTGAMVGTPRYMSPEQVQGRKLDGRSDIYAAGIILYELLVGSPPFVTGDISYQHVNVEPTQPRDICPVITEEVNEIILKCLSKTVDDRYENAEALKEIIDQVYLKLDEERRGTEDGVQSGSIDTTGLVLDL
jgi:tetratricopeptide (TPR) repeat protein